MSLRLLCFASLIVGFFCQRDQNLQQPIASNQNSQLNQNFPNGESNPGQFANNANQGSPEISPRKMAPVNEIPSAKFNNPPLGAAKPVGPKNLISETPECGADVRRICPESMLSSNFNILTCLAQRQDDSDLSDICHTYVWEYKRQMSTDSRFTPMLAETCKEETDQIIRDGSCGTADETQKNLVSCLMLHKNTLKSPTDSKCRHMVNRISLIVFQDYRLISGFYENCKDDVAKLRCGSIDIDQNPAHSQGYTIECLREKFKQVSPECKKEIFLVAELQADDFNLDRSLYFACRDDRTQMCGDVTAGQGKVFECLMDKMNDPKMSTECKTALSSREKLMVEDPKVSFPLREYCMEDLERFKGDCDFDHMVEDHSKMASMLLCLEFKQRNALARQSDPSERPDEKSKPLTAKCVTAMKGARKMLMSDYELNPAIVKHCSEVIKDECGGLEKGGKTLHCLMKVGKSRERGSIHLEKDYPKCFKSIEFLIRSVNPVDDISTDAVLMEACKPTLDRLCRRPNGGYVEDPVGCLFEKIDEDAMTDECEEILLEISYFTARDWALDRKLFRACSLDAKEKCSVDKWPAKMDQSSHGEIFACLYRHINHESASLKLSDKCTAEVIRVMKNRAVSVGLNPYIEFQCRQNLAEYCSDPEITNNRKELECLQDIYSIESVRGSENNAKVLTKECKAALKNYTKVETEEIEINRKLYKSCKPLIETYCAEEKNKATNQGELFNCMVAHKTERDVSEICAAGIEHMQLIQLKDFEFDRKFKKMCREDVSEYCPEAKSKDEVVTCLSKTIRDDKVQGRNARISEECQTELKRPLQERYEDVKLDRSVHRVCKYDIQEHCKGVKSGQGRLLECLKDKKEALRVECRRALFEREEEEMSEPDKEQEKDFVLNRMCKGMIREYCPDEENTLKCLWRHRNEKDFDDRCLKIVHKRMITKGEDVRLNADMFKSCQVDIQKECRSELEQAKDKSKEPNNVEEYQGVVINCLRKKFAEKKLTEKCSAQVRQFIRASAQEWKMDFKLRMACKAVVKDMCSDRAPSKVEECLKEKFLSGELSDSVDPNGKCRDEVKRVLDEGALDIQADPVLQKTCSLDIEHVCSSVTPGNGRQVTCLIEKMQSGVQITADCKKMLNDRLQMWRMAGSQMQSLQSMSDLMVQVSESPNRHYFLTIFGMLITFIFVGGLCFGRVTKRVAREMKSR